jgi:nanoRNase/pAp phosphatase (c-di-AMP/oligoRNAs hydrolase)
MNSFARKLIVTHHAPDLDAISSVWLLKRFDGQRYANAKVAFVNPGDTISLEEAEKEFNCQLHEITHVDTGLGEFDHHQTEKASREICAATLVFDYLKQIRPEITNDLALIEMIKIIVDVDHFGEIYWSEAKENRFVFTLHELIHGHESIEPHDDDSQLHFGMKALDCAYAEMTNRLKAEEIISNKGIEFSIKEGKCLGLETQNDESIKLAQVKGYVLAVRKDSEFGHLRIKVRPDAQLDLEKLYRAIVEIDPKATWFYHASGKMLLNGSIKHRNQIASSLSLKSVIRLIEKLYN